MQRTSRDWLIDAVEYIWQLLAYCSHLQEIVDWYWENETITIEEYQFAIEWIISATQDRREIMQVIKDRYNGNDKLRCAVKHSIFAYTLATEILYANMNWDRQFQVLQKSSAIRMYKTLSKFIGTEVVTCGRCLSDQINDLENNNVKENESSMS